MKLVRLFLVFCVLAAPLAAQTTKPDNTKMNQRDRNDGKPTADQQKGSTSDTEVTRRIRKAIVADHSLSTYAHNVKIMTKNGDVMLRGPVRTEQEKQTIEAIAAEVAGKEHVRSDIQIAPAKTTTGKEKKKS